MGWWHAMAQLEELALSAGMVVVGVGHRLEAGTMPSYNQRGLSWLLGLFLSSSGDRGITGVSEQEGTQLIGFSEQKAGEIYGG